MDSNVIQLLFEKIMQNTIYQLAGLNLTSYKPIKQFGVVIIYKKNITDQF